MYYTEEKLEEIRKFSCAIYNEYRSKYSELWNSNHTFSKCTPVYSQNYNEHPFSIGNLYQHILFINHYSMDKDILLPTLKKPENTLNYQVCYYNNKTSMPFYSVTYRNGKAEFETFHRINGNALISASYHAAIGTIRKVSAEIINKEHNSIEFLTVNEEDQRSIGINNGLTADHEHFNFKNGQFKSIDKINWFRPTIRNILPNHYNEHFFDKPFTPNPVEIISGNLLEIDDELLAWQETNIGTEKEESGLCWSFKKKEFYRIMDAFNIHWFDYLR